MASLWSKPNANMVDYENSNKDGLIYKWTTKSSGGGGRRGGEKRRFNAANRSEGEARAHGLPERREGAGRSAQGPRHKYRGNDACCPFLSNRASGRPFGPMSGVFRRWTFQTTQAL